MNILILSALALLAFTSQALGFACRTNQCDTVKYVPLTQETCNYTIVPHGGSCGCTDACVQIRQEGEPCPKIIVRGSSPPTIKCDDGLVCNGETLRCEKA